MTTGGDDFISARVNFEIPAEASAQMREINTELERLRTNSDAAARSVDSFTRYIQLLNEAQERTSESSRSLAATMERMGALTAKGAQPQVSTAVPTGTHAQPWAGVTEGMGIPQHRTPATIAQVPTGGAQSMFDQLAQEDPRAYLNARAAWGGGKQGELPQVSISQESLDRLAERIAVRDQGQQQEEAKRTAPADRSGGGGGRGRASPQAPQAPWDSWRDRVADWAGTAGTVAGAAGVGGRGLGGMVGRALQNWGTRLQQRGRPDASAPTGGPRIRTAGTGGEEPSIPTEGETEEGVEEPEEGEEEESPRKGGGGGQLGKIGKGLGIAGAGITAGVAAYGAYKKIGGEIQRYRALGQIRGGGFGEGFGYEMQARIMALNPFITTEQSRQIIQSALTQGYTGKEFDTVTAFMASNLKDMNMSVAEQQKLLQAGVHNSNESISGLTQNLTQAFATMKALSQTGYNTLPQREAAFEAVVPGAMAAGMAPKEAIQLGKYVGQEFSGRPGMADLATKIQSAIENKPTAGLFMQQHGGPGGTPINVPGAVAGDPGSIVENMTADQFESAKWNSIKAIADMSPTEGSFIMNMKTLMGVDLTRSEARFLMQQGKLVGTGAQNDPLMAAQQVRDKDEQARKAGKIAQGRKALQDKLGGPFGLGRFGGLGGLGGGNTSISDKDALAYAEKQGFTGQSESLDIEQNLVEAFGGHGFEVGSGKDWKPFDPTNAGMLKDLKSGKIRVREQGDTGQGSKLSDISGALDRSDGTGTGSGRGGAKGSGLSGELKITVHPANMRQVLNVPNYVPITSNEQAANSGFGNATRNNPPPGDGITSRGMRYA